MKGGRFRKGAGRLAEAKRRTCKCWRQFACLEGKGRPLCPVNHRVSEEYLSIECRQVTCPYCILARHDHVCSCPVHNVLHGSD